MSRLEQAAAGAYSLADAIDERRAAREERRCTHGVPPEQVDAWWAVERWLAANPGRSEQEAICATGVNWDLYRRGKRGLVATTAEAFGREQSFAGVGRVGHSFPRRERAPNACRKCGAEKEPARGGKVLCGKCSAAAIEQQRVRRGTVERRSDKRLQTQLRDDRSGIPAEGSDPRAILEPFPPSDSGKREAALAKLREDPG